MPARGAHWRTVHESAAVDCRNEQERNTSAGNARRKRRLWKRQGGGNLTSQQVGRRGCKATAVLLQGAPRSNRCASARQVKPRPLYPTALPAHLHGDEARLPAHELDDAHALVRAAGLHLQAQSKKQWTPATCTQRASAGYPQRPSSRMATACRAATPKQVHTLAARIAFCASSTAVSNLCQPGCSEADASERLYAPHGFVRRDRLPQQGVMHCGPVQWWRPSTAAGPAQRSAPKGLVKEQQVVVNGLGHCHHAAGHLHGCRGWPCQLGGAAVCTRALQLPTPSTANAAANPRCAPQTLPNRKLKIASGPLTMCPQPINLTTLPTFLLRHSRWMDSAAAWPPRPPTTNRMSIFHRSVHVG